MVQELLSTKLSIPPLHPGTVQRLRLMRLLDEGAMRKLTLISAPAGFGKTTLASEWAHQQTTPVAWYSLDESDDDLAHFLAYFLAALQTIQPDIGRELLKDLRPLNQTQFEPALIALINQISNVPEKFTLVLDDYHLIKAQSIHDTIVFLLEHLPPQAHLLIASRADPPLPLARLRARGHLTELRALQLRFTADETNQFLHQMFNLSLSDENITALDTRTEGWVAGLRMAALSLQGRDASQATEFIHSFTGSNRYILDYLLEEVLNRQPPEIQDFIQKTSILKRLTGPLCDAVTGRQDSQAILEIIDRANLFIDPLDDDRSWFRYHRLFADLMRLRLHSTQPAQAPVLHMRACDWYVQQAEMQGNRALVSEAVHHAIQAGETERAALLIEKICDSSLLAGEINTLLGWLKELPADAVKVHPRLCIALSWSLLMSNQAQAAEEWLRHVEKAIAAKSTALPYSPEKAREIYQQIIAIKAVLQLFQANTAGYLPLVRQLAKDPPEKNEFLREITAWLVNMANFFADDISLPVDLSQDYTNTNTANSLIAILSLYTTAFELILKGKLNLAEQMLLKGERTISTMEPMPEGDPTSRPFPISSLVHQGLGEIFRQRNDLQKADEHLAKALRLIQPWGHPEMLADTYTAISKLRFSQNDIAGADLALKNLDPFIEEKKIAPFTIQQVMAQRVRVWITQGDLEHAQRWADSLHTQTNQVDAAHNRIMKYIETLESLSLARLLIVARDFEKANVLLEKGIQNACQSDWQAPALEMQILRAITYDAGGKEQQAIDTLIQAMEIAESEGYNRLFLDEGEAIRILLKKAIRRPEIPARIRDYIHYLLRSYEPAETAAVAGPQSGPTRIVGAELIEPLSEREIEVLHLLDAGLSNQEIAQRLVVAISTIKTHINHLYGKLGVSSRAQAIVRAREMGLL